MLSRYPVSLPLLVLSLLIYGASLFNDGYVDQGGTSEGFALLLMGWLGVFDGVIAWLANPWLLAGWILLGCRLKYVAAFFSAAAIVCIVSFQYCDSVLINEAGHRSPIISYGAGYWLWLASAVIFFLGCVAAVFEPKAEKRGVPVS